MNRMLIFNMLATIDKLTEHKRSTGWNGFIQVVEKMERETGFEPATSSLGIQTYVGSKSLARFCCEFLNLQRLAESAFSKFDAQSRHKRDTSFSADWTGLRTQREERDEREAGEWAAKRATTGL